MHTCIPPENTFPGVSSPANRPNLNEPVLYNNTHTQTILMMYSNTITHTHTQY